MSLSPLPDRFKITIASRDIFGARAINSASACADSRAGIMPSMRASVRAAATAASSVAAVYSARCLSASHACSGQSPGNRGLPRQNVLSQSARRESAVHTNTCPAKRRGARPSIRPPQPCARRVRRASCRVPCFDSQQFHVRIVQKCVEQTNRVGSASDACDEQVRQAFFGFQNLRARFDADHAVKIAHHHRVRMRSQTSRANNASSARS